MMAKRFFYVCAGLLCLAITYHVGARSAGAQAGSAVMGVALAQLGCGDHMIAMTQNGDVFWRQYDCGTFLGPAHFVGNYWASPTAEGKETLGGIKARYR